MPTWDEEVTPLSPISSDRVASKATPSAQSSLSASHSPTSPISTAAPIQSRRVNATDKHTINGKTDVNQLAPFKYKCVWDKCLASCAKHWMPQEINMTRDIALCCAKDTMPRSVLGMNASMFKGYLRYIGNRHASQIGLGKLFSQEKKPFPWMSEMVDLQKQRNFFETRVIECPSGAHWLGTKSQPAVLQFNEQISRTYSAPARNRRLCRSAPHSGSGASLPALESLRVRCRRGVFFAH